MFPLAEPKIVIDALERLDMNLASAMAWITNE